MRMRTLLEFEHELFVAAACVVVSEQLDRVGHVLLMVGRSRTKRKRIEIYTMSIAKCQGRYDFSKMASRIGAQRTGSTNELERY